MKPVIIVPRPRPAPKLVNAMYVNVGKVNHMYPKPFCSFCLLSYSHPSSLPFLSEGKMKKDGVSIFRLPSDRASGLQTLLIWLQ